MLTITLNSTDHPHVTVGVPNTATISIIDDDGMCLIMLVPLLVDLTCCLHYKVKLICRSQTIL